MKGTKKIILNIGMMENHNREKALFILLIFLFTLSFPACRKCRHDTKQIPHKTIKILGDIREPFLLQIQWSQADITEIVHKGRKAKAYRLTDIIERAEPWKNDYHVLYTAYDGFGAIIPGRRLDDCYIVSGNEGWSAVNPGYPVSSNVKDIESIVIIADNVSPAKGFSIIDTGGKGTCLSPGQIYRDGYRLVPKIRGKSFIKSEDGETPTTTFLMQKILDLSLYAYIAPDKAIVAFGEKGEFQPVDNDSYFILNKNSISLAKNGELLIPICRGIVIDPPGRSITDVYKDTRQSLLKGEKILIILLDGFGYHQYEYAGKKGHIPYLQGLPAPEMSMSVYPPITPVNLAASLTGEPPVVNGVYSRETSILKVPTIFELCIEKNLSCKAIIGPLSAINFEIEPVYCMDLNNDGSTDDEKTEYALREINKGYDLIFVHFKDIDRAGHKYGDLDDRTMETIEKLDGFTKQIIDSWSGKVLIYSDHGMHGTQNGGKHGSLIEEDMFTPYWFFRKVRNE